MPARPHTPSTRKGHLQGIGQNATLLRPLYILRWTREHTTRVERALRRHKTDFNLLHYCIEVYMSVCVGCMRSCRIVSKFRLAARPQPSQDFTRSTDDSCSAVAFIGNCGELNEESHDAAT